MTPSNVCAHGHLARQCEVCDLTAELQHWRDSAADIGATDGHALCLDWRNLTAERDEARALALALVIERDEARERIETLLVFGNQATALADLRVVALDEMTQEVETLQSSLDNAKKWIRKAIALQKSQGDRAFYVRAILPLLREIGTDEKWAGPLADAILREMGRTP